MQKSGNVCLLTDQCQSAELRGVLANTRWQQWVQVFPLTEDIELCQLPPLVEVHINLDYTTSHRAQLSEIQEVCVCVCVCVCVFVCVFMCECVFVCV